MSLTPVELRHVTFGRSAFGYARSAVDRLIAETIDSYEEVWRDRADLADKIEQLEAELVRHRELESLLRTTLVSAERSAHEMKAQAKREAQLIVDEAHAEARGVTQCARAERERLVGESRRVRALLESALDAVEEATPVTGADDVPNDEEHRQAA
jgi:cell division initiation protein